MSSLPKKALTILWTLIFEFTRCLFVGSEDPQLRDSWETLSSEEIWNLEQEEGLAQLHQQLLEEFTIQDMKERWEPEWKVDYNYPE